MVGLQPLAERGRECLRLVEVGGEIIVFLSVARVEACAHRLKLVFGAGYQCDVRAQFRQGAGCCRADALARAADQRMLAVEAQIQDRRAGIHGQILKECGSIRCRPSGTPAILAGVDDYDRRGVTRSRSPVQVRRWRRGS